MGNPHDSGNIMDVQSLLNPSILPFATAPAAASMVTSMMAAVAAVLWPLFEFILQLATGNSPADHPQKAMVSVLVPSHAPREAPCDCSA